MGIRCQGPSSNVIHLPNSTKTTVLSLHSRKEYVMHDSFCWDWCWWHTAMKFEPAWHHTLSPG